MARPRGIPSYRYHKGSNQAVVVIDGRSHYLGPWESPESRRKYDRLIAEWLVAGRPAAAAAAVVPGPGLTVADLVLAFAAHADRHYRLADGTPSGEVENLRLAIRPVRRLYGATPAAEFGPLALRAVRAEMVAAGLARTSINARVNRIRRMFRWGASVELLPIATVNALESVAGLLAGRTTARETKPVGPVALEVVEATLPFLGRTVAGLVRLQLYTGMRPGEATAMRGREIIRGEPNWTYEPGRHKTAWRGKRRVIPLGPKVQDLLLGFLGGNPDALLFPTPAGPQLARRKAGTTASAQSGGSRCRRDDAYRKAIALACDRAFPHPALATVRKRDRTEAQAAELEAWRKSHRWHPNQLRHTAATRIRAEFGLEAAQAVLGHARADTTQIYAERDMAKAHEVARLFG